MFRFDASNHEYIDVHAGEVLPHITGMLLDGGLIDDTWFTEESCIRGTEVHRMTADWDLGAIDDLASVVNRYKGYLCAHVRAVEIIRPRFDKVEEPLVSWTHRFGGRPDRVGYCYELASVVEGKTAAEDDSHCVQTALQAILVADHFTLPPQSVSRWCLYWKANGKFKLVEHVNHTRDFGKAYELIRRFGRIA